MKKKKTAGNRRPRETGTWYKSLIEGKAKAEYYRHFIKKLNDIITENFGDKETKRVLKGLDSKKITIPCVETFLFDYEDISDPSFVLFNTCRTVDEFIIKSLLNFKKRAERGETNIVIKDFFLVLADLLKDEELYTLDIIKDILKSFLVSLVTVADRSPYTFVLIEPQWAKEIEKQLGLASGKYGTIVLNILNIFQELMNDVANVRACLPAIKIVYPVYYDTRDNQLTYVVEHFRFRDRPSVVRKALEDIPDLSKDTVQLRSALEYLRSRANLPFLEIDPLVLKLQELGDSTYLKRYPSRNSLTKIFSTNPIKNYYNKFGIEPIFADKEAFEKCLVPYFCDVHIDCAKIPTNNVESFIDIAKIINLTKGYYNKNKRDINSLTFKITLFNVKDVTKDFEDFICDKLRRIESLTNKHFIIDVYYDNDTVNKKIPEDMISYFRVISDIHTDYNKEHGYVFNFSNDFIINCGDTAGNAIDAGNWMTNYIKKGVTVVGNHLGYSSAHPDRDGIQNMEKYSHTRHPSSTKREQMKELFNLLDQNRTVLLSNSCSEFNGIKIIGTCLYTDFNLYGTDHREECMAYASKNMNDFRLPVVMNNQYYTIDRHGRWWPNSRKLSESKVVTFSPSEHAFYFQYSFEYIKKMVEEHKGKPIIIVTHHAPSPYSIDEKYKGSLLNAAFASNLNKYIIEHPWIRLWAHGHVHNPCDYVLGETRVVCCPFGYNNENDFNLPYEYGLRIPIQDIKSKKSWRKILSKDIHKGRIKVYDE